MAIHKWYFLCVWHLLINLILGQISNILFLLLVIWINIVLEIWLKLIFSWHWFYSWWLLQLRCFWWGRCNCAWSTIRQSKSWWSMKGIDHWWLHLLTYTVGIRYDYILTLCLSTIISIEITIKSIDLTMVWFVIYQ